MVCGYFCVQIISQACKHTQAQWAFTGSNMLAGECGSCEMVAVAKRAGHTGRPECEIASGSISVWRRMHPQQWMALGAPVMSSTQAYRNRLPVRSAFWPSCLKCFFVFVFFLEQKYVLIFSISEALLDLALSSITTHSRTLLPENRVICDASFRCIKTVAVYFVLFCI